MVQIIPAILSTKEEDFQKDINKIMQSDSIRQGWVHIDFMDNVFVPNQSIKPSVIAKYPVILKKEAHLMVDHPLEWIEELVQAGFERIIFHIEAKDDTLECIRRIREKGLKVGLAVNHETPLTRLEPYVHKVEVFLLMTIKPGFQGQTFIEESLDKIKALKAKNWPVAIGVDGSVKDSNIKQLVLAGAEHLTVGSYLLKGDFDENVEKLWEAIQG